MRIDAMRSSAAGVLTGAVLAAGCGGGDASSGRTATQPTPKQTVAQLLGFCLEQARKFPDAQSRKQAEAACRAAAADAPTGPNGPSAEDLDTAAKSTPAQPTAKAPAGPASTRAIPKGGPKAISRFPVPGRATFVDLGPAFGGNWQFGISSPDSATTLAFYRKTLTAMGYTIKEDVTAKVGANTIEYDLAFSGPTYGVVDEFNGGTQVTVDDRPLSALQP